MISKHRTAIYLWALFALLIQARSELRSTIQSKNIKQENDVIWSNVDKQTAFSIQIDDKDFDDEDVTNRYRRSAKDDSKLVLPKQDGLSTSKIASVFHLNNSHLHLTIHWAGKRNPVVFVLTRDQDISNTNATSKFYISQDYGKTFKDISNHFMLRNGRKAVLEKYYNHPESECSYVFTDIREKVIFTTRDCGQTIKSHIVRFTPSNIVFDDQELNTFLIHDLLSPSKSLYVTKDYGQTFLPVSKYVKKFDLKSSGGKTKIYVQKYSQINQGFDKSNEHGKENNNYHTTIIMSTNYFATRNETTILYRNAVDFRINGDYIFVVSEKEQDRLGKKYLQLQIAQEGQAFIPAVFDTEREAIDYYIVDVTSDGEIMVVVNHGELLSNLYISERITPYEAKFVLSLERVMNYNPKVTWKNTWLSKKAKNIPFADVYKVEGLRGIYIANQLTDEYYAANKKNMLNIEAIKPDDLKSLITFNQGGEWNNIKIPKSTTDEESICIMNENADCGLHIAQHLSNLNPSTRSIPMFSSKSATGVIMASGKVGKSLGKNTNVYVSRDGGFSWRQVLTGSYFFSVGDHGGVIVAVKQFMSGGKTNELLYSTDEGNTWKSLIFHQEPLKIFGLLTEPGENTTVFTMFGTPSIKPMDWKIITVNLSSAFDYSCTEHDYENWSFSGNTKDNRHCLLGRKEVYERRIVDRNCYNGREYDRLISSVNCECKRSDYICAFGFKKDNECENGNLRCSDSCVKDGNFIGYDPYRPPFHCPLGTTYNQTKGYIKIQGDSCTGGKSSRFEPHEVNCPSKEDEKDQDFLLVSERSKIVQINLRDESEVTILPLPLIKNVIALDYDMENDCVFYGDTEMGKILMHCFENSTTEVLVDGIGSVEGMSYDWVSKNLYFTDAKKPSIEMVHLEHESVTGRMVAGFRKTLFTKNEIKKPRGIAVHPYEGILFYTDWDRSNPHIGKANMDGSNSKIILSAPSVQWPNCLAIDFLSSRVYWVDAGKDRIASVNLDGADFKIVLDGVTQLHHPFAIGIYKDQMYWDDWKYKSIYFADKNNGKGLTKINRAMSHAMDLKVFSNTYRTGNNLCSLDPCSHLCAPVPDNVEIHKANYTCLCPDGMHEERNSTDHVICTLSDSHETKINVKGTDSPVMPRTYKPKEISTDPLIMSIATAEYEYDESEPHISSITANYSLNSNDTKTTLLDSERSANKLSQLLRPMPQEHDIKFTQIDAALPSDVRKTETNKPHSTTPEHDVHLISKSSSSVPNSIDNGNVTDSSLITSFAAETLHTIDNVNSSTSYEKDEIGESTDYTAAKVVVGLLIIIVGAAVVYYFIRKVEQKPKIINIKEYSTQYTLASGAASIFDSSTDETNTNNGTKHTHKSASDKEPLVKL